MAIAFAWAIAFAKCQGTKRRVRKPEHTKEHIMKDSNRYFVKKN